MADWRPNLFDYVDYRTYLGDYYRAAKAHRSGFSYRYLSRRAGFSSPNFVKLVIDGKRNLGPESIERLAEALRLNAEEQLFFANLVAFGQATTVAQKNRHFERIAATRRFREARRLEGDLFDYVSRWYHPVIRELAARRDFSDEPAWVGAEVEPPITARQAGTAIELLTRLGFLVRGEGGELEPAEPTVTSGHEVPDFGVTSFHRQMLERASDSLERTPSELRDISSTTVCVSKKTIPELKRRLREFREELMEVCDQDPDPEVVYQLNMQLFPASRNPGESE